MHAAPATGRTSHPPSDSGRGTAALLVNSTARRAGGRDWRATVRHALETHFHLEFLFPRDAEDSARVAQETAAQGAQLVVAAGGDGTINSVAQGLADTGVPMGILPLGTANDFARELGVPRDLGAASERLRTGRPRNVDLVEVQGRTFCTVGGLVLVAHATMAVSALKRRSGTVRALANATGGAIYRLATTAQLLFRPRLTERLHLTWDDAATGARQAESVDAHALFVTNHRTLGGGLVLPVPARGDDGTFELCVVPRRSRPSLVLNFARLAAGGPVPDDVLVVHRARSAVVRTDTDVAFVADGDVLAVGREFTITPRPGALSVVA